METESSAPKISAPQRLLDRNIFRYGLALGSIALALGVGLWARHYGIGHQFAMLLFAVAVAGWNGGLGPAVVAAAFSSLAYDYFFTEPVYQLGFNKYDLIDVALYISFAFLITWFREVRWRTEGKLRASEQKYRELIDASPDAIFVWDKDGNCVLSNASGARLRACAENELTRLSIADTYLAHERDRIRERFDRAKREGVFRFEHQFLRKDNQVVPVEVSLSTAGEGHYQAVVRDITDRKRAEQELRRQAELLSLAHDAIIVRDPESRITFWNSGAEKTYGWTAAEAIGKVTHELLQTTFPEPLDQLNPMLQRTGRWEGELIHTKADGTRVVVASRWSLRRDAHGAPAAILEINRDVTDRKRAEEAVHQSEKELRDLIGTIPAMAFVTRADGSNEFVSRQWIEFSGLSAEESAGSDWEVTLHPDDVEEHVAKWRAAWTSGKPFESEARHRDANGNYRWLLVRAVPLRDERGNIVKWYGAAIDVEDRKRAEQQVRRSEAYLAEAQRLTHTGSRALKPDMSKPLYWSEEMFRILGFDPEQGLPDNETVWQRVHPEDLKAFMREQIAQVSSGNLKTDIANDYRVVLPDGTVKYIHGRSHPVFDEAGNIVEYVGTSVDVTERKHSEALQNGEKRLLEMIATGVPLERIMNALCLIIEEQRPGTLASVLLMNPDDIHLNVVAAPNLPNDFTQQMESLPIGPCAGSCGTAVYRQSPVMVSDIETDPLWDFPKHRAFALKHGLRASWSNPVLSSKGQVLGTFCVYRPEPGTPTSKDLELMELATHVARVAIERDRAEKAVRASEQLARSHVEVMMRSLDVLATEAAPEKFIAEMLRTIGQRLHARSVLLWLRDPQDDSLHLRLVLDDGQQVAPHVDHPFVKDPHSWKRILPFQEMLFTKGPVVCDNLEQDSRIGAELREYMVKRGRKRFLAIPMFVLGEVRGFIGIQHSEQGAYRAEEVELAQALAHHVMIAIHEDELGGQRRHAVILEERTRMARDIHDTLAQGFTGVIVQLEAVADAISRNKPEKVNKCLERASDLARQSLNEARRSVHALRPEALERVNFWEALKGIIKNTAAGTPIRTKSKLRGKLPQLRLDWQENLMRIGQEALTNTLKYAHADTFETRLVCHTRKLCLEFQDDGDGFNVNDQHDGVGLTGMRERVAQMGGELKITSARGKGTQITVALPCNGRSV